MAQGQGWIDWFGEVLGKVFGKSKDRDRCEECGRRVKVAGNQLCCYCARIALSKATPEDTESVVSHFKKNWAAQKSLCPQNIHVYSIKNAQLEKAWKKYRAALSNRTVEQYYHGTRLECDITKSISLCDDVDCGICGIAKTGFNSNCIKKNIDFQRFGHGFYLAPNSSKCHDYTQGKNDYRAMLLFDVCPGNKYYLQRDDKTLNKPPPGYNSVYGKAGVRLNYDELVLYDSAAALPKYVIVYEKGGIEKIAK